jgi:hypothetical protein
VFGASRGDRLQVARQQRARGGGAAEGCEFLGQHGVVDEGEALGLWFHKEVEGVDGRHLGDEVHGDLEMPHPLGEDQAGAEIALRVLHPVQEMGLRRDVERIGQDGRAAMRRWAQPDQLGREPHQPVIAVARAVGQRGVDAHRGRAGVQGCATAIPLERCAPQGQRRDGARMDRLAWHPGRARLDSSPPGRHPARLNVSFL